MRAITTENKKIRPGIFIAIYETVLHPNVHITVLCFNKCFVDIEMASHKRKPIIIPKGTNKYTENTSEVNRITQSEKKKHTTTTKSTEREKKIGVRVIMEIRFESNEGIAHTHTIHTITNNYRREKQKKLYQRNAPT